MSAVEVEPAGARVSTASVSPLSSTFSVLGPLVDFLMTAPLPSWRLASGVPVGRNAATGYGCVGSAGGNPLIAVRTPSAAREGAIPDSAHEPPHNAALLAAAHTPLSVSP